MKPLVAALIAMMLTTPVSAHVCEDYIYDMALILKNERISCYLKMDDTGNIVRGRCSNGVLVSGTVTPVPENGYKYEGKLTLRSANRTTNPVMVGMYDRNDAWGVWEYRDASGNLTRSVPFIGVVNSNRNCKEE